MWIAARGLNMGLMTRIYFPDADSGGDPVYTLAGPRAATMLAEQMPGGYTHVIHLRGEKETVFFDV